MCSWHQRPLSSLIHILFSSSFGLVSSSVRIPIFFLSRIFSGLIDPIQPIDPVLQRRRRAHAEQQGQGWGCTDRSHHHHIVCCFFPFIIALHLSWERSYFPIDSMLVETNCYERWIVRVRDDERWRHSSSHRTLTWSSLQLLVSPPPCLKEAVPKVTISRIPILNSISLESNIEHPMVSFEGNFYPVALLRLDTYAVLDDVVSRFWFTYRTGFAPIGLYSPRSEDLCTAVFSSLGGPSGPTKDTGWGCMMRCGQMMLAEGYLRFFLPAGRCQWLRRRYSKRIWPLCLHLDFRWRPNMPDKPYWDILNMFIDKRHSSYSIHQIGKSIDRRNLSHSFSLIVQMGNSEGKDIGQWFGPNTIAQVLR